jgi:hypothetical protein
MEVLQLMDVEQWMIVHVNRFNPTSILKNKIRNANSVLQQPLWSSDQSSWLQIQRSRFVFRRYHIFWLALGLERDPLSLMSITEELLGKKVAAPVYRSDINCHWGSAALTTRHLSIRKS